MNNRFSKLFLVGVACAAFFVRSHAPAATYYFDLHAKTLEGGTMALGESADIILRNIGESSPADLRTLLCDKEGVPLAASTNGFSSQGTSARGRMSLATTNLAARFEGMGALKEIPLVFAVWDATLGTLLGSDTVQIRNNPFADATGSVPSDWGGVDYGDKAIAQLALAMAQLALDTANATSGRMDALQGEYTAATNELWRAMDAATGGLSGDISALSSSLVSNTEAWVEAMLRFDRRMDELAAGIEPAFTNGTARGLALSPLDQGELEGSDLSTTPGMYYTTRTNEVGVVVERLLRLVGGLQGVVVDGILSPDGITLGTSQNPLYDSNTLTVTNWGQITNRYEELYGFTHGNINRLNTFTNDIWKYAQTNRLLAYQIRDSLANERLYRSLSDDSLSNLVFTARSEAQGWRTEETTRLANLEAATGALNTATGELNTIARTNQAAISNLWNAIAPLSGMTTAAFTNGTARGLAVTPIDHADFLSSFRRTPGLWATTEYDYRGDPIGQYLFLNGWYSSLALTPTGIVADATIHAPGYTLGTNTVTDWRMFATAEELAEMENRVNGQFNDISDAFAEDFATYTYVDTKIAGISNMMGGITVSNGEVSVDLVGLTDAISDLQIATNHIADNYVKKSGDTMADWLIVRRLIVAKESQNGYGVAGAGAFAQGTAPWILGENGFAAGNHAKVTNGTAFVWSGASGTNYYGSHGDGSFSINPVGGLDGTWIGDRNLRQHFYNETVTALSGMHGGVELLPGANITITTNPVDGTLTIASSAGGGGGGAAEDIIASVLSAASNSFIPKWPHTYSFETSNIPTHTYPDTITNEYGIKVIYSSPGTSVGLHSKSIAGIYTPLANIMVGHNSAGVRISSEKTVATGDIKAASFTLGTNTITKWPAASAIETLGEEVFKAQVVVTTNSPAITGFEVDADNDEATITFYASVETNRLEWYDPAEEEPEWAAWDNCSWSYTGTQGTCTLVGPQEGAFYRILVPEGYTTPDRTNVYLVASVPIYFGEAGVEENRFATMADVAAAVARGSGTTRIAAVTRRGYSDPMNVSPTNVAWNFSGDGVYFQDLSVGGWTNEISTVTTNGGTVTTNTTTVTDTGSITLNGQRIHSWGELAIYADGAEITVETGVSGVNGIEGAVTLEAGDNVTLSKNDATGTITISATGGGGGGGGGGGSGPWNPNTRVISATNATVLASDYLIWMDSETAQDEQTIHLPDMATDSQSIVIRHLGSDHPTTIVRATAAATNTYTLSGDGAAVAVDWLGAKTNWYWRQAY